MDLKIMTMNDIRSGVIFPIFFFFQKQGFGPNMARKRRIHCCVLISIKSVSKSDISRFETKANLGTIVLSIC